jgi:hypothetical protein
MDEQMTVREYAIKHLLPTAPRYLTPVGRKAAQLSRAAGQPIGEKLIKSRGPVPLYPARTYQPEILRQAFEAVHP